MTKEEIEAAKAAFLAKGGKVEVVPMEAGGSYTPKQWNEIQRNFYQGVRLSDAANLSPEQRAEIRFQQGVEENGYYKS